jgi:hypothetical protein
MSGQLLRVKKGRKNMNEPDQSHLTDQETEAQRV